MNSNTKSGMDLAGQYKTRTRVYRKQQALRLSVALALGVGTVAFAQSYRVLKTFTGPDGSNPEAGLAVADNTLYGTTYVGGSSNCGVVFKVSTDGSGYSVLKNFTGSDGDEPVGSLVVGDVSTLCGTTLNGGSSGYGAVFKVNTDGLEFSVLKNFTFSDGMEPYGCLALSGSTVYGTSWGGGSYGQGVVFKINIDGSGYSVLKNFSGSDGMNPQSGLVLAGSTLYGTTSVGGTWQDGGVVFKVNTDGSGYTVLKNFAGGSDGGAPIGRLILLGSTLYGTTAGGGTYGDYGLVFKVNTNGTGFAVLKNFAGGSDGQNPQGGLVLAGNALYGTTREGGSSDQGLIFKINTDGSGYAVLKNFNGSDGAHPVAGVILVGNTFYGTTESGGDFNLGVVFSLSSLSITTQPLTQTAEAGTAVHFRVASVSATPGLSYQWLFDETNALDGATNALLELTNVQPAQAGAYTVVVTNLAQGSVTSAPAMLSIIAPIEKRIVPAIRLMGTAGSLLHVEHASSLDVPSPQWVSVSDVLLTGGPQFCFDLSQPPAAHGFYRAWQTNAPRPALDATIATQILLTGAIRSSVRIDYINQFGPINAWVALDTITLTNTTQFYYDLTVFRQPQRLYRLVPLP